MLGAELSNTAFDPALESEALHAEPAHGPVRLIGPGHKRIDHGERRIYPLIVELNVRIYSRAGKAGAIELAGTQGRYHGFKQELSFEKGA